MKTDGGLRPIFREHLPGVHWTTIETAFTEPGVPDLNGCYRGVEFWIENKATSGWVVSLRTEQIGWLLRRTRVGGRAYIAIRRHCDAGPRRPAADELWLYEGSQAALLATGGMKAVLPLRVWEGGPSRWDWPDIVEMLCRQ